ncbi:DUF6931 family protein [Phreatobacter sp. AB_2022a]|uniref:DUF6931 family protein n=1 Tax=Phreatobacter sp. AB_2022a TaxID=3003134 RepID=UPI002286EB6D|nr:hypothetical protein [Phreatobacter sp. AB_2022a]MCZ0737641.1 hypothetical protein [Phreatobacter sp. AB_2022a]
MATLRFATARDVAEAFPTLAEDMLAEPGEHEPLAFLRALADGETPEDAISFCAYVLPRRDAVWWACRSVRALASPGAAVEDVALTAAEAWVRAPSEASRIEAMQAGQAASSAQATTWAAFAAAWSGGNLSVGEHAGAPAPAHLTAKAVRACLLIALARISATERRDRLRACIEGGIRLAAVDA